MSTSSQPHVRFTTDEVESVSIFDTTLRDGEQTPGTSFSLEEKIRIAKKLDDIGVDVIEAGFPINGEDEREAVREIVAAVENATVCGLARVEPKDIEVAIDTGVDMVHTFVSTSDIQIEKSLNSSREEVLQMTQEAVESIKAAGLECMFSPMDATRSDFDYLVEVIRTATEAGADIVNIPDTVGVMNPTAMKRLIAELRSEVDVPYDVHCHDDFGLATANSLAGIEAGASQAQVSVNGIGERAGNTALEELVMSLESIYDVDTGIETEKLYELSKLVERLSDVPLPGNKPIVGANAFSHESGIHAAGVIEDSSTFEPGIMTPDMVGQDRNLVMGKHTGTHSVRETLEKADFQPTDDEVRQVTEKIKSMGSKGKRITDTDIFAIAESVMTSVPKAEKIIELESVNVTTGNNVKPVATVEAIVRGERRVEAEVGVGPVDAATKAVALLVDEENIDITEFHIDAISGGSDAVGTVTVGISDVEGTRANAQSSSDDITVASVEALVDALNHLERKRKSGIGIA